MSKKLFPAAGGRQLFDGGLNSKYAPSIIGDNESPDCLNVIFNAGAAETRQGTTAVNTTAVGSFACDGIYSYRNNSNAESMCAFFGDLMYTLSGTTFYTVPSAQSVFTHGTRVASEQMENYIFFGNGSVLPYKYNGAFTRHGVYPPTQTATVASNGAGNLTGGASYLYAYSNVNTNVVESNLSPISTTFVISATSGQNTVSNIQTAPVSFGANNTYLYRTKANTVTPFFRLTTLAAGVTTFTDNVADSALTIQGPTDNGVPPNYNTICYAEGRLFCNDVNNPGNLCYSNAGNPYTFSALSFSKVGDNTSDLIKGLYYYNKAVVIFCEKSIWFLYLVDGTPANWVGPFKSNSSYGSKSPFGIVTYNNKVLFPAMYNQQFIGFGALSGNVLDTNRTVLTVSTAGSDLKSDKIEPDMYQVQSAFVSNISATVYKKKAWIAVTYGPNTQTNSRVYQMDFSMSTIKQNQEVSWCPFTGINAAQFCVYQGNLYFGSATANGFVYQCETGNYNDNGAAINSYIYTKEFSCEANDPEGSDTALVKDFRYVNTLVDTSGTYNMNFTYRVDSDKGLGVTKTINLSPGGSLWGSFIWGLGLWGGGKNQIEPRIYLDNASGRRIQFRFDNQNTANQKFKVYGLNFLYNLKGYR